MDKSKHYLSVISQGLTSGEEMPSLPQIIVEVQKAIKKDDTSVHELAKLILDDMSMTGKVLKLANSAYYRRSAKQINTVTQAIVLLGFGEIQKMIMAISAYEFFGFMTKKRCFRDIWKHSLCVGLCSQSIAETLDLENPESYLIGGLLHDIGKFVMGQYFPEEYEEIIQHVRNTGCDFDAREKEVFGCSHSDVGALVAKHWNLPEQVCKVISRHDFDKLTGLKYEDTMTQIVCISDLIAKKISGYDLEQQKIKMSVLLKAGEDILDLDQNQLLEIVGGLGEEIYRIAHMLDIAIDELKIDLESTVESSSETISIYEDTPTRTLYPGEEINVEKDLLNLSLQVGEICISSDKEFSEVCHDVLTEIKVGFDLKYIGVFIKNAQGVLNPISFQGPDVDKVVPRILFKKDQATILSHALDNNKSVVLSSDLHKKLPYNSMLTSALGSSVMAVFPLTVGKNPKGVVLAVRDQRHSGFSELERRVLGGCVQHLTGVYMQNPDKK